MALLINLRHLEDKNVRVQGELTPKELEIESLDEVIHARRPLRYDLEAQKMEQSVLVTGTLALELDCECVRCLTAFRHRLQLDRWVCHLLLEGDDKVLVVSDCLDLTPYLREDIVLAFPQHPLCKPDCGGLANSQQKPEEQPGTAGMPGSASSAWAALDKLKL